ncbi:MAG: hypothetical protein BAJALOKI2v1_20046 [Promethearchaeota archaeon]|nr:MAG: hypothetical protein BAJALOKI2v1_20046 [Candidatus Lokiarchaeota archaeon]
MDIFKWVEDIEETYKYIMERAEEDKKNKIEKVEKQEKENRKKTLNKKRNFVDRVLKKLESDIHKKTEEFHTAISEEIESIRDQYEENQTKLIESIKNQLEMNF